jgi:glycine betaine/proline transport system substrate-binding protein
MTLKNKIMSAINRRHFLYFTTALMGSVGIKTIAAAKQAVPNQRTVVLGQIGLSFYAVVGAVVQSVLETLGHRVDVKQGDHAEIFPVLGRGEVDLLVAAWLPGAHGPYWEQYQNQAIELGTLYEDARLFWAVPEYIPQTAVNSVEDLLNSEVIAKMTKTIQGIGPSSGLMRGSSQMMQAYGLQQAGYTLRPGTAKEWIDAFEAAVAEERWEIVPLWQPQFLNRAYQVRPLQEPKGLLGGKDRAVLVVHQDFERKFPPRTVAVLKRMYLGLDAVTEMDYQVNVAGMTPKEAAIAWMSQNSKQVESWMAQE